MSLTMLWETKPDFINEQGTKWWIDKNSTIYARTKDLNGNSLPTIIIYMVENVGGERDYLMIDEKTNSFVDRPYKSLEELGAKIDILKLSYGAN